jgi:hypothetical protein
VQPHGDTHFLPIGALPRATLHSRLLLVVLKAIRTMISPVMKPDRQEQLIVNQAKNFIKNTGVKLS